MQIDKIDNFPTFEQLRTNWDAVYEADPQAHFFLSWVWLSGWLPIVHEDWFILAIKPDCNSSYVAFFPLKMLVEYEPKGFKTNICTIGNSMADYTGLICLPGYETEVLAACTAYIKQELSWSSFDLKSVLEADTRIPLFLENFDEGNFELSQLRIQSVNREDPNIYIAPYINLPDTWESYLQNHVSSNTRQKIRRFLRKVTNSEEFRITHVNADNLESQIDILLDFWESRWKEQMRDNYDVVINYYRLILNCCFHQNCLYLPVLWQRDRPLGAIANFIDVRRKSMLFVITGRDRSFKTPPPGLVLHSEAIRYAIEQGFKVYDFLMGDEKYKYSFGVKERHIKHIVVKNKNYSYTAEDAKKIVSVALKLTARNHRANRLVKAEQGYRHILSIEPNRPEAIYGLAVLMRQKGQYQAAEELLHRLLKIEPDSVKALFGLGNLYQTQNRLSEAIAAYSQVLTLQPNAIAAYNNLGYVLQQQGKWSKAIACYQKALELQPKCIEAEVNQANALHTLGKLDPQKQEHYAALNHKLGFQCEQVGDIKTAVAYYQQSLALNPNLAEVRHNLDLLLQEAKVTAIAT